MLGKGGQHLAQRAFPHTSQTIYPEVVNSLAARRALLRAEPRPYLEFTGGAVSQGGLRGLCGLFGVARPSGATCAPWLLGLNVRPSARNAASAQEQTSSRGSSLGRCCWAYSGNGPIRIIRRAEKTPAPGSPEIFYSPAQSKEMIDVEGSGEPRELHAF